jgi:hypothetical protein
LPSRLSRAYDENLLLSVLYGIRRWFLENLSQRERTVSSALQEYVNEPNTYGFVHIPRSLLAEMSASSLPLIGKIAIVTGASRSIGYGIALKLAQQGANVSMACCEQEYPEIPSTTPPTPTLFDPKTRANAGHRSSSDTPPRQAAPKPPSSKQR